MTSLKKLLKSCVRYLYWKFDVHVDDPGFEAIRMSVMRNIADKIGIDLSKAPEATREPYDRNLH